MKIDSPSAFSHNHTSIFRGAFMLSRFSKRIQSRSVQYRLAIISQTLLYCPANWPLAGSQEISSVIIRRWNIRYLKNTFFWVSHKKKIYERIINLKRYCEIGTRRSKTISTGRREKFSEISGEAKREIESLVSAICQGLLLNADAASVRELIIGIVLPRYAAPFSVENELVPLGHVAL